MTDLEPILRTISDDAVSLADNIKKDAEELAQKLREQALCEAERIKNEFEEKIAEEIEQIHFSKSAELDDMEKIANINAKARAVESAAKEAARRVGSLEDGEYLKFIKSLIKKAELDKDSRVWLNERDKKRLPESLFFPCGVADGTEKMLGGFRVLGKNADFDFTIEAILEAKNNEICDAINRIYQRENGL